MVPTLNITVILVAFTLAARADDTGMQCQTEPVTRLIHVVYSVPQDAPDRLLVRSFWSPRGRNAWQPDRIQPLLSDTACGLLREEDWLPWIKGEVVESRAAGLKRTLVFNPYPDAQASGVVDIDFRVELYAADDRLLARLEAPASADNRDVVYLDDWSGVIQK